jgi:putative copper export protein
VYWRWQIGGGLVAGFALVFHGWSRRVGWMIAALAVVVTAVATSMSSHAGAADTMRLFGVLDDAVHILAASSWLGGLFMLIVVGLSVNSSHEISARARVLVNAFSRVALTSAALVLFTGVVSARFRVGTIAALVSSEYGTMLLVKLALVGVVGVIGFYNWRFMKPKIASEGAADALRSTGRRELIMALFVILATAILVGLPLPTHN